MQADAADLLSTLQALEVDLHQPRVRRDPARLDALLHADFLEFGRSGRAYRKADILAALAQEAEDGGTLIQAGDFSVTRLGPQAALLTYRSIRPTAAGGKALHSLRSSVWQWQDGRWQLLFHQGTPTEPLA